MRRISPLSVPAGRPHIDGNIDDARHRAVIEGRADIQAGRIAGHDEVMRWLASWGTDNELPPPKCG